LKNKEIQVAENIKTFIELLSEYEVCIPIIQRDYAQGRDNEKSNEVRKNLIRDIKNCLDDTKQKIDFNFVYGTLSENKKVFYPVDGQQRLTTLYLLHWFLACNCENVENFKSLNVFSYMTRNSATEFFRLLRDSSFELIELVRNSNKLKKEIENQSWFQAEWSHDPTVDGALTLIDDISKDNDFRINAMRYYDRLKNSAIEFTHIIEQGDDAELKAAKSYIRMNARGKSLEPFENLKAMLDSIDDDLGKCNEYTDIVSKYDREYIDTLYKQCNQVNLLAKTESINNKSFNLLKNIYNLNCHLTKKKSVYGDANFINEVYEISQKSLQDEEKNFFVKFLGMAVSVFDYFVSEPYDELICDIFEPKGDFNVYDNRRIIATVLYVYYQASSNICKENLEKYLYVLKNLSYESWSGDYIKNISNFTKAVAEYDDVFMFFSSKDVVDIQNMMVENLEDIDVRIKEQKIKVDIINKEKVNWKFFDELESKTSERKIQYLLFITDYWNGGGSFDKLNKYTRIATKYFLVESNDLRWRKNYAIASFLDNNDMLYTASDINRLCSKKHIWSNSYYYWNDEDEKELCQVRPELEIIKKAYQNNDNMEQFERCLHTSEYDLCWLRYAIKFSYRSLLSEEVEWDSGQKIVKLKYGRHRYDVYLMHIVFNKQYQLKKLREMARSEFAFEAGVRYEAGDKRLSFTNYNVRRYIMRLNVPIEITDINENYKHKGNCLYSFDEKSFTYTVYQVKSPYIFEVKSYILRDEIQLQLATVKAEQTTLESFGKDDYLEVKDKWRPEWKQDGRKTLWIKYPVKIPYKATCREEEFSLVQR